MVMTFLVVAFTSAETRAVVMLKMVEENGVGRFYEDKAHCVHTEVVRLSHMQVRRDPVELPDAAPPPILMPASAVLASRIWAVASPRAPPHGPRGPPVTA